MSTDKEPILTAEQSFLIIAEAIRNTKSNFKPMYIYFVLWGWVVVLANLGQFALMRFTDYEHPFIVWLVSIPAWIATYIIAAKQSKSSKMVTHLDKIISSMWIIYGISLFVLLVFGQSVSGYFNPLILIFSAIPTYTSGVIVKFKAFIQGGLGFILMGSILFLIPYEWHSIASAIAFSIGYIVPGYLLKRTSH